MKHCFHHKNHKYKIGANHPLHNITQNNDTKSLNVPITEVEIRHAINKLKSDQACGPDETCIEIYQSPLTLTELFQHDLINVSYLTACYLYQVMMTLHFLNDVANDAESTQKSKFTS